MATLDVSTRRFSSRSFVLREKKSYDLPFDRATARPGRDGREMADDDVVPSLLRIRAAGTFLQSGWYQTRSNVDER